MKDLRFRVDKIADDPEVKKRRPGIKDDDVFSGRVFIGETAKEKGLVDDVSTLAEMIEKKWPGREDIKLVEVKRKLEGGLMSLIGQLFGSSVRVMDQFSNLIETSKSPGIVPIIRS